MTKKLEINKPSVPVTFTYKMPPRPKQEGWVSAEEHPISEFTKEEAEEFAELLKTTFLNKWSDLVNAKEFDSPFKR